MNKGFNEKNGGITLIALVVTIVVLLILAGVSLNAVIGNSGIINRTQEASKETDIAQIKEAIDFSVTSAFALDPLGDLTTENLETTLAQNMPTDYELSGNEASGWTVEVPSIDKIYKINSEGDVGEYIPIPTVAELKESGEEVTENTTIKDDDGESMTIPGEFKIASDSATDIDEGVVVEAPDGSQFVWVPVPNAIWDGSTTITSGSYTPMATTYTYNGNTYYRGMLYTFSGTTSTYQSGYTVGTTSYREPSLVTQNSADTYAVLDSVKGSYHDADNSYYNTILGYDSAKDFGKAMQQDYNAMVESVAKYGGFFVGRYETSYKTYNLSVASIKNATSANASNTKTKYWYGLYQTQKEYASKCSLTSVSSSMIWGSQYDAMMIWMCSQGINVSSTTPITGASKNTTRVTGSVEKDKLNNIYDLLGNSFEWTLEAENSYNRMLRGGRSGKSYAPSVRLVNTPNSVEDTQGSRLTLYIK